MTSRSRIEMNILSRSARNGGNSPVGRAAPQASGGRRCRIRIGMAMLFLIGSSQVASAQSPDREGLDWFETKIRPVLVEHCYGCHSVEAEQAGKLRGELWLDSRDASRSGGESGPAVVPGKPDESLLLSALRHDGFEMPPKGKLSDEIIADFAKWIELGAPDPRDSQAARKGLTIDVEAGRSFWSFRPLQQVLPPVDETGWSRTPIDQFVIAAQKKAGSHPNPSATARLLVRRAWFDLLGLPPTPEELESWVVRLAGNENSDAATLSAGNGIDAQAWGELIDHLLASPHYGHRWARHWMDVARFAESHGYEQDYDRPNAYHYRDFLIQAFNQDLPYNDFVRWQLAGDELAPQQPMAWMATGFLGGGAFPTQLTETEFESARYDELDDMVATTGVAFLGLSTGCARCHDHKFSPIPSSDYYRLAACFTTAIRTEKELDLDPTGNAMRRQAYEDRARELQDALQLHEREVLPVQFRKWLAEYRAGSLAAADWEVLQGEVTSTGGTRYLPQQDGSYLATGEAPPKEVITLRARAERTGILAVRLEALADESLPGKGPGRADNGNFALGDFRVGVASRPPAAAGQSPQDGAVRELKLTAARATHQQNDSSLSVAASIDDDPVSGWAIDGKIGQDAAAIFFAEQPFDLKAGEELVVTMAFEHPNQKHVVGRFRLSITSRAGLEPAVGNSGPDARIVGAIERLATQSDAASADWPIGLAWFQATTPEWQQLRQALAEHQQQGPPLGLAKVLVTSEGLPPLSHHADGRGFPHFYPQTHFLRRGDVHQKGDIAAPGFLQVLLRDGHDESHWQADPAGEDAPSSFRRASLAKWMTDVEHGAGHLAARVIVNRLWQHHFGSGIVPTPNDFGGSGELPSHPELLDWLAADLIAGDWRLKRMHKQIMTSSVYMQSSEFDPVRSELDPDNRLLWRRVPRRLEAEAIRDAMLAVSGQLDPTPYGPGSLDANMRRRSVYFFIKRSQLIPMMMLFDWPEHLVSIGQRSSTTTAPQALHFINSPQARSSAEAWAGRLRGLAPGDAIRRAYAEAFGRPVDEDELRSAHEFFERQTQAHREVSGDQAAGLAMADLCQMLLSMNEFIYVD